MTMTDNEFQIFVETANAELRKKQTILADDYGLGSAGRWWFDQETGNLQFFDATDNLFVETDVIDIGSYSPKSNSWKWAWSNDSVLPWLRQRAGKLKELEAITGIKIFGHDNSFTVKDDSMAWELTAMCIKHLRAVGCYRCPSSKPGGPTIFLAIMSIKRCGKNAP
jgi:hypothetical protein